MLRHVHQKVFKTSRQSKGTEKFKTGTGLVVKHSKREIFLDKKEEMIEKIGQSLESTLYLSWPSHRHLPSTHHYLGTCPGFAKKILWSPSNLNGIADKKYEIF